jgi:hypothetical protein
MAVGVQGGADHIVSQQCLNGGFGWPHADCTTTYNNITAPICLGLLDVYTKETGDPAHLNAAIAGGDYDLTSVYGNGEFRFGSFAPYFLSRLTAAGAGAQYSNHASVGFFDELTAKTYGPSDFDTAGWIGVLQAARSGSQINLRSWDLHSLPSVAGAIGNPNSTTPADGISQKTKFEDAMLDGLDTLDDTINPATDFGDMLAIAGAVRGLALDGTTAFPAIVSVNHAGINTINTLDGLANKLVSYQNANGSWYWHSNLVGPVASDEDTQSTAYAVLALLAADPLVASDYLTPILKGQNYLRSMQLANGGFLSYPGGGENTEVEGESLSAIAIAKNVVPALGGWGLVALTIIGLVAGTILFTRSQSRRRMA